MAERWPAPAFAAQRPTKPQLPLPLQGIDAVAATAVNRPFAPILLQPHRQEDLHWPLPRLSPALPVGTSNSGKDRRFRQPVGFLNEPEFRAQLGVAIAVMRLAVGRRIVSQRRDEVELHVGDDAVVQLRNAARCRTNRRPSWRAWTRRKIPNAGNPPAPGHPSRMAARPGLPLNSQSISEPK